VLVQSGTFLHAPAYEYSDAGIIPRTRAPRTLSAFARTVSASGFLRQNISLACFFLKTFFILLSPRSPPRLTACEGQTHFQEEQKMSRRSMNRVMTVFAALVMLVAIAAPKAPAKDTKAGVSTTMSLVNPLTFAGKELKPGDYAVSADETHVQLSMNGKVVAEAPVQWKDETSKAKYSTFVSQGNKITEIHFGGKSRFVTISE
jgi:hypothetical protein